MARRRDKKGRFLKGSTRRKSTTKKKTTSRRKTKRRSKNPELLVINKPKRRRNVEKKAAAPKTRRRRRRRNPTASAKFDAMGIAKAIGGAGLTGIAGESIANLVVPENLTYEDHVKDGAIKAGIPAAAALLFHKMGQTEMAMGAAVCAGLRVIFKGLEIAAEKWPEQMASIGLGQAARVFRDRTGRIFVKDQGRTYQLGATYVGSGRYLQGAPKRVQFKNPKTGRMEKAFLLGEYVPEQFGDQAGQVVAVPRGRNQTPGIWFIGGVSGLQPSDPLLTRFGQGLQHVDPRLGWGLQHADPDLNRNATSVPTADFWMQETSGPLQGAYNYGLQNPMMDLSTIGACSFVY